MSCIFNLESCIYRLLCVIDVLSIIFRYPYVGSMFTGSIDYYVYVSCTIHEFVVKLYALSINQHLYVLV